MQPIDPKGNLERSYYDDPIKGKFIQVKQADIRKFAYGKEDCDHDLLEKTIEISSREICNMEKEET